MVDRVDVLEEGVANDPGWDIFTVAPDGIPNVENGTGTQFGQTRSADRAEVRISSTDGLVGTTESDGNGKLGVACCMSDTSS